MQMHQDLADQISKLKKSRKVDLRALITCVVTALAKPACTSISFLGDGVYNKVYKLSFKDGSSIAASVSSQREEDFNSCAKLSEFATMEFVRNSGLYPEIIVPDVYAYDTSFTNPVGAPYTLMQLLEGKTYESIRNEHDFKGIDLMSQVDQLSAIKAFAKLQAVLSRPVPFDKIGSIVKDEAGSFTVGPLFMLDGEDQGGPYHSIEEYWRARLDLTMLTALQEWPSLESDHLTPPGWEPCPTERFSNIFQQIAALIPHFIPPIPYLQLVLYHPDLALRNVFFDPQDYSKIIGVIDWTGAQILPLIFTALFPHDIRSDSKWPFQQTVLLAEIWNTVAHDWTSLGNTSRYPEVLRISGEPVDYVPRVKATVRQYYLRQYFSIYYVKYVQTMHSNDDVTRATLFADALYYLKFHETLTSNWMYWARHANWIEETYWRLWMPPASSSRDTVIIGPNTYRKSCDSVVCDLEFVEGSHFWRVIEGDAIRLSILPS